MYLFPCDRQTVLSAVDASISAVQIVDHPTHLLICYKLSSPLSLSLFIHSAHSSKYAIPPFLPLIVVAFVQSARLFVNEFLFPSLLPTPFSFPFLPDLYKALSRRQLFLPIFADPYFPIHFSFIQTKSETKCIVGRTLAIYIFYPYFVII